MKNVISYPDGFTVYVAYSPETLRTMFNLFQDDKYVTRFYSRTKVEEYIKNLTTTRNDNRRIYN